MELRERGVILIFTALNESPSEKEGKWRRGAWVIVFA